MDKQFNAYFLYGYLYSKAEDMKNNGLFDDFTIKELIKYLIDDINNGGNLYYGK